ncbi:hypothetical protein D3C87_1873650 [compost metagenome]
MADNVLNAIVNDFVGYGDGLFWVTGIVVFHANQLIPFDAAFGVDVFDRLTRAVELHIAPLGNRTGHGTDDGNFNVFRYGCLRNR